MKYTMFVVVDPDHSEEDAAAAPDLEEWFTSVRAKGNYLSGVRLHPVDDATTVRVRGGDLLVTDGPFTESKEWIAGFAMLECAPPAGCRATTGSKPRSPRCTQRQQTRHRPTGFASWRPTTLS